MNQFLDKTITLSVRQVWRWIRRTLYLLVPIYLVLVFLHSWDNKVGGFPLKASPYYLQVPPECRTSVMKATTVGSSGLLSKIPIFQPETTVLSLPLTEEKLGYGMKGLPCMGWDFLTSLHVHDMSRVQKFVDARGDLIAILTLEVKKPFHAPLTREEWNDKHLPGWSGLDPEAVQKDSGFVGFSR